MPTKTQLADCLRDLLSHAELNTCLHEDTYRGGAIWTICRGCGAKWADDRGGMPASAKEYPKPIKNAQDILEKLKV